MASSGRTTSCFQNLPQVLHQPYGIMGGVSEAGHDHRHVVSAAFDPIGAGPGSESTATKSSPMSASSSSLLYNLSVLRDKVHQVQSLATLLISPGQAHQPEPTPMVVASMGTIIQEIIFTASSMMFTCQQMATINNSNSGNASMGDPHQAVGPLAHHQPSNDHAMSIDHMGGDIRGESGLYPDTGLDWYEDHHNHNDNARSMTTGTNDIEHINHLGSSRRNNTNVGHERGKALPKTCGGIGQVSSPNYDIIELDAAELLAKYTHYCQICGKGFKRDANLRMHMRAHGDEYKSSGALSNPLKKKPGTNPEGNSIDNGNNDKDATDIYPTNNLPRKYSCPQEGCRWNQKHAKFQPLKSMICVKNHYKRSHCPKMYICKQCNRKQFSVLSDLRTHEKHCGDIKWQCSCGTTFSRKDKLMGHVALFTGHSPMINLTKPALGKAEHWSTMSSMQIDDRRGKL